MLRGNTPSNEKGPEPQSTSAIRHAKESRSHSYPGGPNLTPAAVAATSWMELKPYLE